MWVNIPRRGHVGVGRVTEAVQPGSEFTVPTPERDRPCLEVLRTAEHLRLRAGDPEKAEQFVRVAWLDAVPESKPFNKVGLFGNQNTFCRPQTPKWRQTVERLKTFFANWNA